MTYHANVIPMSDQAAHITHDDVKPTILPDAFIDSAEAKRVRDFRLPRYQDLPAVALYRDQVITYIDQALEPLTQTVEGRWLTPSMVNNYVKAKLVPAPEKKLYGTEHVARLIVVCIFKQVLPIAAIQRLFEIQRMTYTAERAYDYTATELEHALATAFSAGKPAMPDSATRTTRESLLVRNAVTAFATRAQLMSYLAYLGFNEAAGA